MILWPVSDNYCSSFVADVLPFCSVDRVKLCIHYCRSAAAIFKETTLLCSSMECLQWRWQPSWLDSDWLMQLSNHQPAECMEEATLGTMSYCNHFSVLSSWEIPPQACSAGGTVVCGKSLLKLSDAVLCPGEKGWDCCCHHTLYDATLHSEGTVLEARCVGKGLSCCCLMNRSLP